MKDSQLKQARQQLGLTQQGLADKLGIKLAKLRNWEQGRNAVSDEGATAIKWLLAGKIL
ncbi:MAG: helix-turn-helix domain-containing protein [Aeromonadaceae bacterium]